MRWFCLFSISVIYVDFSIQLSNANNIFTIHTNNFLIILLFLIILIISFKSSFKNSVQSCFPLCYHYMVCEKSISGFLGASFRYGKAVVRAPQNLLFSKLKASVVPNIAITVLKLYIFFFSLTLSCLISS